MTTKQSRAFTETAEGEIVITRAFDAPRERLWQAWTDPAMLKRWWGPAGFTAPEWKLDLRVGGRYLYCMRSPDGQDFWGAGAYREIAAHERLVFTDAFADAEGNEVPASHYGMAGDWPEELLVTLGFEESDGKTTLTLRHAGIPAGEHREMCAGGWNESLDKLAAAIARP